MTEGFYEDDEQVEELLVRFGTGKTGLTRKAGAAMTEQEQASHDEEYLESIPAEEVSEALRAARKEVAREALRAFAERERIR